MPRLVLVRRFAITALLIAFFLPLSKCSQTAADGTITVDYKYPIENVVAGTQTLFSKEPTDYDDIVLALLTLAVFFLPAAIAVVKTRTQSIAHLVLTGPAEWLLYSLSTIGDPQPGGIIAMSAWGVLFLVAVISFLGRDTT